MEEQDYQVLVAEALDEIGIASVWWNTLCLKEGVGESGKCKSCGFDTKPASSSYIVQ